MPEADGDAPGPLRADLHTHSTASDGELTPAELVHRAVRQGLFILALTDHDTTAGVAEAIATGVELGVRVIAGVEISADSPTGEIHLLGYGIDRDNVELQSALASFRNFSSTRLRLMLDRLRAEGIDLSESSILREIDDESVGRPHVARAIVAAGFAESVSSAFDGYLSEGRPAYVRKQKMAPDDAIALIRTAGGLPVLAHPCSVPELERRLPQLVNSGLRGLECFYSEYDQATRIDLVARADKFGFLTTGGSDFHGEHTRVERVLGSVDIPQDRLRAFLTALSQSNQGH